MSRPTASSVTAALGVEHEERMGSCLADGAWVRVGDGVGGSWRKGQSLSCGVVRAHLRRFLMEDIGMITWDEDAGDMLDCSGRREQGTSRNARGRLRVKDRVEVGLRCWVWQFGQCSDGCWRREGTGEEG